MASGSLFERPRQNAVGGDGLIQRANERQRRIGTLLGRKWRLHDDGPAAEIAGHGGGGGRDMAVCQVFHRGGDRLSGARGDLDEMAADIDLAEDEDQHIVTGRCWRRTSVTSEERAGVQPMEIGRGNAVEAKGDVAGRRRRRARSR
jgi:hypothetical protein